MSLKRTARYYFIRFKRLQGSTHSLALGSALGAAIGITPTIPFHAALILALTLPLRVNSLAGLLAATVVSNPLTFAPQYYLAWLIGNFFLPNRLSWGKIRDTLAQLKPLGLLDGLDVLGGLGWDALLVMLSGGLVLSVPTGVLTYFFVFRLFAQLRAKQRQKHLLNN